LTIKRVFLGLSLGGVALVAALPAPAGAEVTAAYVACSSSPSAPPAEECVLGDSPAAFFESDEDVEYAICVEPPLGSPECLTEQGAEAGELYFNQITAQQEGLWWVDWYLPVEGEPEEFVHVAEWPFLMNAPPAPPAPPPPPPPPPPTVIEPTVSTACLKAQRKVGTVRAQLRAAEGRKRKARLRTKLKRAKAAAKRVC
jgi:hypothetical protein